MLICNSTLQVLMIGRNGHHAPSHVTEESRCANVTVVTTRIVTSWTHVFVTYFHVQVKHIAFLHDAV